MNSHARVVVIGGGVVGVGTLYHLVKKGWSDVMLVERKELTSGSTWHAAGLLPLFNVSYSVGQLHKYSVAFYPSLEAETEQNVGFQPRLQHPTGLHPGSLGRIQILCRGGEDDRCRGQLSHP